MKTSKNKRIAIAKRQNNICPICKGLLPPGKGRRVYDPDHNTILCRLCGLARSQYQANLARGVTPPMLDAYEARSPAAEIDAQPQLTKTEAKQNNWRLV